MKYRLKEADGTEIDRTVEDTWWRIAKDLAHVETEPKYWEEKFYEEKRKKEDELIKRFYSEGKEKFIEKTSNEENSEKQSEDDKDR